MQVGDLATWVSSAGTVGALIFTAYTLRRQIDRERRADDEHRRIHAKRVRVVIVPGPVSTAEVSNDGDASIYRVVVYLFDRQTQALFAKSDDVVDIMAPGTSQIFPLVPVTPGADIPSSRYCFAQFTDDNGYRWSRYVMGLLEEAGPENEISRKQAQAQLVKLSATGYPPSVVEVSNAADRDIHHVAVIIRSKPDGRLIGVSESAVDTIAPASVHRFEIIHTEPRTEAITGYFCIAQFTDSDAIKWNRYLMGRLDKVSPDPPRDRPGGSRRTPRRFFRALGEPRRQLGPPRSPA